MTVPARVQTKVPWKLPVAGIAQHFWQDFGMQSGVSVRCVVTSSVAIHSALVRDVDWIVNSVTACPSISKRLLLLLLLGNGL